MRQDWSTLEPGRSSDVYPTPDAARLCRLALDEARVNRNDLEKLYTAGACIVGDLRYDFLWRMSQLERVCAGLERCAVQTYPHVAEVADGEDIKHTHEAISKLALEGVEIRQDIRAIL